MTSDSLDRNLSEVWDARRPRTLWAEMSVKSGMVYLGEGLFGLFIKDRIRGKVNTDLEFGDKNKNKKLSGWGG
jgi:hypothetical protein